MKSVMTTKAGSIPKLKGLRKTHKAVEEGKEEEGPAQRPVCMAKRSPNQSVTNIFEYSNIRIFLIRIFIRVFVRIIFRIRIYSDIRSCQLFGYEYIRIFVRGKILIRIYSDISLYQFSGHKQIQKMFLLIFSGYYALLMDILLISMIKNAI